ncbi:MAG TPA: AmmeMemoRadiSam system protein B [Candidatus Polarisedimenticolia bacterium]|nr:AmmeMemoRadiSam system protein B [Candidatus Polarisedimenticolia bacterium]
MIRRPAVAGSFYPAGEGALRSELEALTAGGRVPQGPPPRALLVPHAGYVYSGRIAARTYLSGPLPGRFIVLGPNHTGEGDPIAVQSEGAWRTPLGDAPIDAPLAAAVLAEAGSARVDAAAHRREHAIEVQIPFLQHLAPGSRFVPIVVGTHRLDALLDLGRGLARAIAASPSPVTLVLSSDMTHYEPADEAERRDRPALERILAIDPEGLWAVVRDGNITMCGVAPAVAGLEAARRLGAARATLVVYGHSGQTTGDTTSVVAYAGVAIP